ncbi:class I SAM-dependent methyltransferase [uncultured Desulfovibrio sp.]|uniref:class I SAM-dependent methyltransferase n=1 Tax=uncultured Desulfovibrio sp. TaxID=167968 RepID=UPI0026DBB1A5|nr:class I SAM-dependent methyltransferase [uncultured Desulfovibrio sp.]
MPDSQSASASDDFSALFTATGYLLPPRRLAHSHWMSHVPFAFWLMEALRPRLLVELGAYTGVSFGAFCQQVDHLGLETNCYAVDTWQGDDNMGHYGDAVFNDITAYLQRTYPSFAYCVRAPFDDALELFQDGSVDLIHIDGYHSREAMLHDFEAWLPKVSPGGVILMHDINARIPGYGGVRAWEEIAGRFPCFAFAHGYGLGVVLPGKNPPQRLRLLVEGGRDEARAAYVRGHFSRLGALYENILERQRALEAAQESLKKSEMHLVAALQDQEKLRMDHTIAIRSYSESKSWKLTRPLRAIANYFRQLIK